MDDYVSMRLARKNLKSVLNSELLNLQESAVPAESRNKIINAIQDNKLTFGYLALMITDDHPLLDGWAEKSKRRDLHFILGRKILGFENDIVSLRLNIIRFGNDQTEEGIRKEMAPYKKFQQDLLKIAVPLPMVFRK